MLKLYQYAFYRVTSKWLGKPMSLFIFVFDYRATRIFIYNSHNHIFSLVSPTSDNGIYVLESGILYLSSTLNLG